MPMVEINAATGLKQGTFGIGTFSAGGKSFPALVKADGEVISLSDHYHDTLAMFEDWDRTFDALVDLAEHGTVLDMPFSALRCHQPIERPNLIGSGSNYRTHMAEMMTFASANLHRRLPGETPEQHFQRNLDLVDERGRTGQPMLFSVPFSAMCGANDDVILPPMGVEHDWELELGVVIGKTKRFAKLEEAHDLIAGYCVVNDLGTVDQFRRTDTQFGTDLIIKYQPSFKPVGPFIVPKQFVDRTKMRIQLKHNGTMKQDWPVEDMVFTVEKLVTFGTERMNMLPGDIIFCGSPPGNGVMHGHFMVAGDVIEAEITGLGRQRNRCFDEVLANAPHYGPWNNA